MREPPPGYDDILGDADGVPDPPGPYHSIEVEGVGPVRARKPMPNAVPNLAHSVAAHIDNQARADHLTRFVRNHLEYGEADRLLQGMIMGDLPAETYSLVGQAIATWGTGRPT